MLRAFCTAMLGLLASLAGVFGGTFALTAIADWLAPYIATVLNAVAEGLVRGYRRVRRGYYQVKRWWWLRRARKWRG